MLKIKYSRKNNHAQKFRFVFFLSLISEGEINIEGLQRVKSILIDAAYNAKERTWFIHFYPEY